MEYRWISALKLMRQLKKKKKQPAIYILVIIRVQNLFAPFNTMFHRTPYSRWYRRCVSHYYWCGAFERRNQVKHIKNHPNHYVFVKKSIKMFLSMVFFVAWSYVLDSCYHFSPFLILRPLRQWPVFFNCKRPTRWKHRFSV